MAELADSLEVTEDDRIEQAQALVRSYCGWHIAPPRTDTFRVYRLANRVIILPSLHVTEVVSVTADGVLLADDTYHCSESGVLTLDECGFWGYKMVVVVFTHGYLDPPAEVTAAVQSLAQRAIDNPTGATSYSSTDGPFSSSVTFSAGVSRTPGGMNALDRYRLPALP